MSTSGDQGDEENRVAQRHVVYVGTEVELAGGVVRNAFTHDISASGLLLLTNEPLSEGAGVVLWVYSQGPKQPPRRVKGSVVRAEAMSNEERGLWSRKVAVKLDALDPLLEAQARELSEKQAAIYAKKPDAG